MIAQGEHKVRPYSALFFCALRAFAVNKGGKHENRLL
jgi:hypothetical protein